ncbi:MAG: tyrosine-type recombinase/integrase [Xanthobacteraceae bacterium]
MAVEKLTAIRLQNLKPPAEGFVELWDELCRGLCLRVFASGKATWAFRYRPRDGGTRRRIRLGEYPSVGLSEARKRADRQRGQVADGADPQGDIKEKRKAPTLGQVIERYLTEYAEPLKKPRTVVLYKNYLRNLLTPEIRAKKIAAVTHADVAAVHREIGARAPVAANRAIAALSGVYTFADKNGLVPENFNPTRRLEKFREQPKEYFLTNDDLARLGATMKQAVTEGLPWPEKPADNPSKHRRKPQNQKTVLDVYVAAAIYLLLFTGCRLGEILELEWSQVDLERGMLFLPDSKTGKKPVVLNAPALAILQRLDPLGKYVIPGDPSPNGEERRRADLKRPWDLIRHHAGLEGVRLHDLRHTHASIGAGSGMGLPIIGKLLGHKNPATTARYAHLAADPVRRASNQIGSQLSDALGILPAPANSE